MINTYLPQILIFIGLLLTFLGGLISFVRDESIQKENKELGVENKKLIESNINLSNAINNNVIGGDSFGVISPTSIKENGEPLYFFYFNNNGNYPMYDIELYYFDQDEIKHNKQAELSTDTLKYYHFEKIGNMPAKLGRTFGNFEINENEYKRIAFSITAKNGNFLQQLRMIKRDGKLLFASQVKRIGKNPEILFETVPEDFPKKKNDQVDWE